MNRLGMDCMVGGMTKIENLETGGRQELKGTRTSDLRIDGEVDDDSSSSSDFSVEGG